jgi:hypothetical protein
VQGKYPEVAAEHLASGLLAIKTLVLCPRPSHSLHVIYVDNIPHIPKSILQLPDH